MTEPEPVYRNVSVCKHGIKNTDTTHIQDGAAFWFPACHDSAGKGYMRPHVANADYPVEPLPAIPRRPRSDRGQKRGPRK